MTENLIVIPNVDKGNGSIRHEPYHFSIDSWKQWGNKNNAEVLIMDTPVYDPAYMTIPWQRYHLFYMLEENKVEYDQILMVDGDTIVHPDCPNFFEMSEGKYCGVLDLGCWEWTARSIRLYQDMFPGFKLDRGSYFNGGFQIINKEHEWFFDEVLEFYRVNDQTLLEKQKNKLGTDQTPVNYLVQKHEIDFKLLPPTYNLHHMVSKNLLPFGQGHWIPDSLQNLYEQAWVYHFNAIPDNPEKRFAKYFMERTYNELYG